MSLARLLELDADGRRAWLRNAADQLGGLAALGRALGYRDGAYVGQMIRGERAISEKTLRTLADMRPLQNLVPTDGVATEPPAEYRVDRLGLEDALHVVLDSVLAAPVSRWPSLRAQLDHLVANPAARDEVVAELRLLLRPDVAGRHGP